MSKTRHFIIGTAGHIDHGKSTLVEALTGTNPDRLPEEKARGMTIDLGFAHLPIEDPEDPETTYSLGLIDVPGHADFVKNMVAGVGAIDAALLVVAGDDGWMPQTEEHLQILEYLGVERGIIAVTKADLLDDPEFFEIFLRESLEGTRFADFPVIPVCALKNEGVTEIKAALAALLRDTPDAPDTGKARLNVDRVFSPKGVGTVVTGTLTGGQLEAGAAAKIYPNQDDTIIRNVQNHLSDRNLALPGMRTALNLSDVTAGHETGRIGVGRGDTITTGISGAPSLTLDVHLTKSARPVIGQPSATTAIRHGQTVRLHLGSGSYQARLFLHGGGKLEAGQEGYAQLRLKTDPAFAFLGDRFVLRDWSKRSTIAGGIILDPDAGRHGFQNPNRKATLETLRTNRDNPSGLLAALLKVERAIPRDGLLAKTPFSSEAIDAAFADPDLVQQAAGFAVEAGWWKSIIKNGAERIQNHHKEHPNEPGLPLADLRAAIAHDLPHSDLFQGVLDSLTGDGFVRAKGSLRAAEHLPELSPALTQAADRVRAALDASPMEPPNPTEAAPSAEDQQALKFLLDTGEAVQIDPKVVLLAKNLQTAKDSITEHIRANGPSKAADLRSAIGTTRRILIPLLEMLDRDGFTVRNGDHRTLKTGT